MEVYGNISLARLKSIKCKNAGNHQSNRISARAEQGLASTFEAKILMLARKRKQHVSLYYHNLNTSEIIKMRKYI